MRDKLLRLLGVCVHYWGVPHKNNNGVLVVVCYGCSTEKPMRANLEVK